MPSQPQTHTEGSLTITTRSGRSLPMALLQTLVKPLRPLLTKPTKIFGPESPKLSVHRYVRHRCHVTERQIEDVWTYDLVTKSSSQSSKVPGSVRDEGLHGGGGALGGEERMGRPAKKRILFFAGGSWQMPPSPQHWRFCAEIARRLGPETTVSVVSTPLAPRCPAEVSLPWLVRWYRAVMEECARRRETVVLMGDSSGGNVAFAVLMCALEEEKEVPVPSALFLISPACNLGEKDPRAKVAQKNDPVLTLEVSDQQGKKWSGSWDGREDWRLSPVLADVSVLVDRGVQVHGVTGSYDILEPDEIRFREVCRKAGIKGQWLDWEGGMHCYPLTWFYRLPEGVWSKEWVVKVLDGHVS